MDKKRKGGAERNREKNKKLLAKCAEKCIRLDSFFREDIYSVVTGSINDQLADEYNSGSK